MLRCLTGIIGYRIDAIDGEIGKVRDFLFEDVLWTVRHVVVEGGSSRDRNRVLVRCDMIGRPDWSRQVLPVSLTVDEISSAAKHWSRAGRPQEPAVTDSEWLCRWPLPGALALSAPNTASVAVCDVEAGDPNVSSVDHVIGYEIRARDGKIGRVFDFVVDDEPWRIKYLVVSTGNWLPGRKVLVAPEWVKSVSPEAGEVKVGLSRNGVKACPEYDPLEPVNCEIEPRLYDYCGRPHDWEQVESRRAVW